MRMKRALFVPAIATMLLGVAVSILSPRARAQNPDEILPAASAAKAKTEWTQRGSRPSDSLFSVEATAPADEPAAASAPYRVLARKYRPRGFDDLIGQEPMVRTLSNAFETGRIPQACILTGVRGVGKTTTARIFARALNYASCRTARCGPTSRHAGARRALPGDHGSRAMST